MVIHLNIHFESTSQSTEETLQKIKIDEDKIKLKNCTSVSVIHAE